MNAYRVSSVLGWLFLAIICLIGVGCTCGDVSKDAEGAPSDAGTAVSKSARDGKSPRPDTGSPAGQGYTASVCLLLSILGSPKATDDQEIRDWWESGKREQENLVKSEAVIVAALLPETWEAHSVDSSEYPERFEALPPTQQAKLKAFNELHGINARERLAAALRVPFPPKNARIMVVSLAAQDPVEAAALLNAVVRAYYSKWVKARERIVRRLKQLDSIYDEKEKDLRNRSRDCKELSEHLGMTDGPNGPPLRQRIAVEQLIESHKELSRIKRDLQQTRAELKVQESLLADKSATEVSDADVEVFVQTDSMMNQVFVPLLADAKKKLAEHESRAGGNEPQTAERLARSVKTAQEQVDARREALRKVLQQRKQQSIAAELRRLQGRVAVLEELVQQCEKDMERDATEAEKLSKKWSEKGFIQEEIGQLRKLLNSLDEERDKLRVEPAQGIRVQILGNPSQPAEVPTKPD